MNIRVFRNRDAMMQGMIDSIRQLSRRELEFRIATWGVQNEKLQEGFPEEERLRWSDDPLSGRVELMISTPGAWRELEEEPDVLRLFLVAEKPVEELRELADRWEETIDTWIFMLEEPWQELRGSGVDVEPD